MDKLAEKLFGNIELVIRHLLSGIAIYAIYLLSLSNPTCHIEWISRKPLLAALGMGALGFVVFSLYRITFWALGDEIAYRCKLSSTAHAAKESGASYAAAYAKVLAWRRGKKFDKSLSSYLHYRWAVLHFTFIVSVALVFALTNKQSNSFIDRWDTGICWLTSMCSLVAIWQAYVLFSVDGELYKTWKQNNGSIEAQPGVAGDAAPKSGAAPLN